MFGRAWGIFGCALLLILMLPDAQAKLGQRSVDGWSEDQSLKPEAIAGKSYSKNECVRIARWVIGRDTRLKALTGIEVGNFWYTLDSCGFLYFSDPKTLNGRPSDEQIDVEIAIEWATHEYIGRLVAAIDRSSPLGRNEAFSDLSKAAGPTKAMSLLPTLPAPVGASPKPEAAPPVYERVVRVALPHDLKPGDSVACIGAHNDKGELYDLGCNTSMEHDPMVGIYRVEFSENPDGDPRKSAILGNVAGSAWKCHFAASEVTLICERIKK